MFSFYLMTSESPNLQCSLVKKIVSEKFIFLFSLKLYFMFQVHQDICYDGRHIQILLKNVIYCCHQQLPADLKFKRFLQSLGIFASFWG
jgi:hypothetical protein